MKEIKKLIIIVTGLLLVVACEDTVLNLEDPGSPTDATFFQSEAELEIALVGIYESLNFVREVPFPQLLDHTTDYAFNRGNVGGTIPATTGGLTSTEGIVTAYWDRFYTGIQRANNLLGNMEKAVEVSDPTRFEEIRGEALFLRAFFYSYLTELYGDVPFRTSIATLDDLIVPRTPKSEIIPAIIADLEEAASVLPSVQSGAARGRASGNAAKTLIARIALYNEDYPLAASSALEVINSGEHGLFGDYKSLFTDSGVGSTEILLDLSYTLGTTVHGLAQRQASRFGGWCQLVPAQQTIDSYETVNGLPIDEDPLYDPANPFDNRDPRLAATIALPNSIWTGHIIQQHSDSIATWRVEGGENVERVFNPNAANPGGRKIIDPYDGTEYTSAGANRFTSFSGYFWRKFSDEPTLLGALAGTGESGTRSEETIYLMRYAEVLLIYAEAKIESGTIDGSVLNAINEVRERAYNGSGFSNPAVTTTDQAELRKIVRRERKVELADEGFRLFDIKRWGIAEKVLNTTLLGGPANGFSKIGGELGFVPDIDDDGFITYSGAPTQERQELGNLDFRELEIRSFDASKHYLWPIPQSEIDASGGVVTQNSGY
ncbi:RagB/SusD family nutrient uptake outer membrane protein [Zobellia barbeyronii]|uniref:RagB/SusD family nutrient uptake outer membrane protein n=1 Tax=Zobellia barbeyronii TaxID=2748009 RepID=A0ABS5WDD1_9FLAO|nr:RagB/SusD family nutrient uptake outer membrane protein [Zobellia barbeyronii]MBT2161400.1 RagB/SusD family nutrient uptake outer membrane protein [Zobellia barbeyronii]